jgi:hypothetical protein
MAEGYPIKALDKLMLSGSCPANSDALDSLLNGLAHPCANGQNWVISQRLLTVRQQLNSDQELIAAVLATESELQNAWCQLMAARCLEAGELTEPQSLIKLVSQLNDAAAWIEKCIDNASLNSTGFEQLERSLLGVTAEQSPATPILARVLAAASQLQVWQQQPLAEIPAVDASGGRPDINWCSGRLIQQPGIKASEFVYLLNGQAGTKIPDNTIRFQQKEKTLAVMDWVLANPWAYLLALIVYEQNIWQVEAAGELLLELPAGQSPQRPSEVQVLVANTEGDEVFCGHLGSLVGKILRSLNMDIFPSGYSDADLNAGLSTVIHDLLDNKIWRFMEGLSGEQGYYQIHMDFSDACYGRKGQPSFSRYARHLRQAVRSQAIQWRNDRKSEGLYKNSQSETLAVNTANVQ